jgi:hypothetical protein
MLRRWVSTVFWLRNDRYVIAEKTARQMGLREAIARMQSMRDETNAEYTDDVRRWSLRSDDRGDEDTRNARNSAYAISIASSRSGASSAFRAPTTSRMAQCDLREAKA